jgi:Tol biopolymer transport system component
MGGLDPGWSPDGRYLVFDARNDTPSAPSRELPEADKGKGAMDFSPFTIQIVDVAQGMERALTPDTVGGEVAPAWSPDGWRVAFLSDRSGAIEVWVIDADGNNLQQVTFDSRSRVTAPAWVSLMIQDKP